MAGGPDISVVVSCYQRAALVPRLVEALAGQVDVDHEVILVDNGSADDTGDVLATLVAEHPDQFTLLRIEVNRGPARARNLGWRAARAPVVAFTDDDCAPEPRWLAELLTSAAQADIVQGVTRPDPRDAHHVGPFIRTQRVEAETGYYQTCNVAYRRAVLEAAGGFDERYESAAGEDSDLAWRAIDAGASTAFAPDAVVHHCVRPSSWRAHLADIPRWEGLALVVREHPTARTHLHRRLFWKPTHPPALAALAGALLAVRPGAPLAGRAAGLALALPYVAHRRRYGPWTGSHAERAAALPRLLVADLLEVAVLVRGSIRYRTLVL